MADEEAQEMEETAVPAPPPPKKKSPLMLILAVLLVGAAMGAGGWFIGKKMSSGTHAPTEAQNAVETQLTEDVKKGGEHGAPAHATEKKEEKKESAGGHGGGHGAAEKGKEEPSGREAVSVVLGPVATNLNDLNIRRNVSVTLAIKATSPENKQRIEDALYELQSQCLLVLSSKTQASLKSVEGKELLLDELKSRFEQTVGKGTIESVLYTQFATF